ncbi:acyltransferase, partial [Caulobacter sp. 17J65-9]|uniref:acyltransferase family protein n=1 Tax=Caulobacter sp. 17J65-9 TaxID=2709382 RepID=UPI0013CCC163
MAGVSNTVRPERGGALDALRFIAAAFVVLYHYGSEAPVPLDQVAPVLGRGWLATDFFLLLSGYVLGRAYGAGLDAGRWSTAGFVGRRLRRVWPAHLLVLLGFVALVGVSALLRVGPLHPGRFGAESFWLQAALVHAWGTTTQPAWNVPSWTLSALVACYLAFPPVWRAARSLKGRTLAAAGALVVLALAAALSLVVLGRSLFDLPFQYGVLRALPLFVAGALLARFRQDREIGAGAATALALAGAAGLLLFAPAPRSALADFAAVIAIA